MRNYYQCHFSMQTINRLHYRFLCIIVQCRCRFIKNKNLWLIV